MKNNVKDRPIRSINKFWLVAEYKTKKIHEPTLRELDFKTLKFGHQEDSFIYRSDPMPLNPEIKTTFHQPNPHTKDEDRHGGKVLWERGGEECHSKDDPFESANERGERMWRDYIRGLEYLRGSNEE